MLKWTVSRSLSANNSTTTTPRGRGPSALSSVNRRPFRDLSNTPSPKRNKPRESLLSSRRKRRKTHGDDGGEGGGCPSTLQVNCEESRSALSLESKSESESEPETRRMVGDSEGDDRRSAPRMFKDIAVDPPTPQLVESCGAAITLPTDRSLFLRSGGRRFQTNDRNHLQSHVSDFFQQISVATSPEDVMEADSVPLRGFNGKSSYLPKLARIARIHARCKTPYRARVKTTPVDPFALTSPTTTTTTTTVQNPEDHQDRLVADLLDREQTGKFLGKTVAEILLADAEERDKVLRSSGAREDREKSKAEEEEEETEENGDDRNDSSISSASQLLEDPSPMSWPFVSPGSDVDVEFPLKRQRGIRRKRPRQKDDVDGKCLRGRGRNNDEEEEEEDSRVLIEAVNPNVKRLALETDLDSTFEEERRGATGVVDALARGGGGGEEQESSCSIALPDDSAKASFSHISRCSSETLAMNSYGSSTPETPLVATVRRCLKFSPESEEVPQLQQPRGSIEIEYSRSSDQISVKIIRCKELRRACEGPIHAYVKATLKNSGGETIVKRTAVHKATPNPIFHETLNLPCPFSNDHCSVRSTSLDIAVWHRDRRARRSELLGCMTLPLPLTQNKEATWHPLEAGTGRNTTTSATAYPGIPEGCAVSPAPSKEPGEADNNNSGGGDDLIYLRHLELEPLDPLTGLPLYPGFTARGGRTPCTVTRRLIRQNVIGNQVAWGFSLSWGRPPRVERVDPASPAERSGLKPGDHVVFVETVNVVTKPREEILSLIQASTNQLVLEVYRKTTVHPTAGTTTTTTATPMGMTRMTSNPSSMTMTTTAAAVAAMAKQLSHRPSSMNVTLQHSIGGGGVGGVGGGGGAAAAAGGAGSGGGGRGAIGSHQQRAVAFSAEVGTGVLV